MNFLDSNIILYGLLEEQNPLKHEVATRLLKSEGIVISTQVITKVGAVLIRKSSLSPKEIHWIMDDLFLRFPVLTVEREDILDSFSLRESYRLSYWDSLIVAVALRAGAEVLYTEDSHNGMVIRDRLTIRNSFA